MKKSTAFPCPCTVVLGKLTVAGSCARAAEHHRIFRRGGFAKYTKSVSGSTRLSPHDESPGFILRKKALSAWMDCFLEACINTAIGFRLYSVIAGRLSRYRGRRTGLCFQSGHTYTYGVPKYITTWFPWFSSVDLAV